MEDERSFIKDVDLKRGEYNRQGIEAQPLEIFFYWEMLKGNNFSISYRPSI